MLVRPSSRRSGARTARSSAATSTLRCAKPNAVAVSPTRSTATAGGPGATGGAPSPLPSTIRGAPKAAAFGRRGLGDRGEHDPRAGERSAGRGLLAEGDRALAEAGARRARTGRPARAAAGPSTTPARPGRRCPGWCRTDAAPRCGRSNASSGSCQARMPLPVASIVTCGVAPAAGMPQRRLRVAVQREAEARPVGAVVAGGAQLAAGVARAGRCRPGSASRGRRCRRCRRRSWRATGTCPVDSPTLRSTGTGAWKRRAPGSSPAEYRRSDDGPNSCTHATTRRPPLPAPITGHEESKRWPSSTRCGARQPLAVELRGEDVRAAVDPLAVDDPAGAVGRHGGAAEVDDVG